MNQTFSGNLAQDHIRYKQTTVPRKQTIKKTMQELKGISTSKRVTNKIVSKPISFLPYIKTETTNVIK